MRLYTSNSFLDNEQIRRLGERAMEEHPKEQGRTLEMRGGEDSLFHNDFPPYTRKPRGLRKKETVTNL